MLSSEVIDVGSGEKYIFSYFEDDTIETMRLRIANALNSHPDRLFIIIGLKFKHDYYQKDPRRWDALFKRLSYNDISPIDQVPFQEYLSTYRSPPISIRYEPYEKSTWMSKPSDLEEIYSPTRDFTEYRLFGTEDTKSYILPLNFKNPGIGKIPAAQIPSPSLKSLLATLYTVENIVHFKVVRYDDRAETMAPYYFPSLTSSTPVRLTDESVNLLEKNTTLLKELLALDITQPSSVNITRVRFYSSFVETNFGNASRTRFEQIFYGITLSEDVPCVTYFTSQGEVSRHKFFVKNPKTKKPEIDFPVWKSWTRRQPYRNQPTLIFYRGDSDKVYDRISVTPEDIVITVFRENKKNTKTVDQMKKDTIKWLKKFDAIMAFVHENDIDEDRWEAQDIQFSAKYELPIDELDTRRLNCVSSLFNRVPDRERVKFNILRTDQTDKTNSGITPIEMKIIQMKTEGMVRPIDVAKELNISLEDGKRTLEDVDRKLEENPNLADRAFRGFPSVELKGAELLASSVTNINQIVKYGSMLRHILGQEDRNIDRICPKRMEKVSVDTGVAPAEEVLVDSGFEEEYGDIFGYLQEEAPPEEKEEEELVKESQTKETTSKGKISTYGYFVSRLLDFDRNTFETTAADDFDYPKKCQQPYQPIIMNEEALQKVDGTEFDPKNIPDNQKIELQDPNGTVICPEYWCSRDQIPLTKDQLANIDGELACPICDGKVRTNEKDNPREYTVYTRKKGFIYPGFLDEKYKSSKTGKLLPCCKQKPMVPEKVKTDDKYYIVLEGKVVKDLRISYLKESLINSLQIKQEYELFKKSNNRIANGMGGFFRVGLGKPSENLPSILGIKTKLPNPHEVPQLTLKCSFVRTWNKHGDTHLNSIESLLKKTPPYNTDSVVRESLTKIISGISEAYEKNELSVLQELEYIGVVLQIDIFRIFTKTNTLACFFYSQMVKPRTRGIIILQDGSTFDIIAYVTRVQRDFTYKANVFDSPFTSTTYSILEKLRTESCRTQVPNYSLAMGAIRDILGMSGKDDFQVILDPYGRGQAFYIPSQMIVPFQPVVLPDMAQIKLLGFTSVDSETIPKYTDVRKYLELAEKYSEGYSWAEDLYNSKNQRVEVLLKSGLRIPVYPETVSSGEPSEIIQTTSELGEDKLVFGESSQELETQYKQISYASEIYEFLIYQLTKDLEIKEEKLRALLLDVRPKPKEVEPLLREWFDITTEFIGTKDPINFVSKIRSPCGQFTSKAKCSGSLCAWNGKTCKIQVRESVNKEKLFHRLFSTLIENSKIRAMVLDGRTSPFFTTVLFLELPNELILTDLDIVNIAV